jgi:hypothetical protein
MRYFIPGSIISTIFVGSYPTCVEFDSKAITYKKVPPSLCETKIQYIRTQTVKT